MFGKNGVIKSEINFQNNKRKQQKTTINEALYNEINYNEDTTIKDSAEIRIFDSSLKEYDKIKATDFKRWNKLCIHYFSTDYIEKDYSFYYPYELKLKYLFNNNNKIKETGALY